MNESLSTNKWIPEIANALLIYMAEHYDFDAETQYRTYIDSVEDKVKDYDNMPKIFKAFIEINGLWIQIKGESPDGATMGYYSQDGNYIRLYLNEKYNDIKPGMNTNIIYSNLYFGYNKILIHELRHAYDDYISNSRAILNKQQKHIAPDVNNIQSIRKYVNSSLELAAFFIQALQSIQFFDLNDDVEFDEWDNPESWTKTPWSTIVKEFKKNYDHWRLLTPTNQRNQLKKLAAAYTQAEL